MLGQYQMLHACSCQWIRYSMQILYRKWTHVQSSFLYSPTYTLYMYRTFSTGMLAKTEHTFHVFKVLKKTDVTSTGTTRTLKFVAVCKYKRGTLLFGVKECKWLHAEIYCLINSSPIKIKYARLECITEILAYAGVR